MEGYIRPGCVHLTLNAVSDAPSQDDEQVGVMFGIRADCVMHCLQDWAGAQVGLAWQIILTQLLTAASAT